MKPIIAVTAKQSTADWVAGRVQPYLEAIARASGETMLLTSDTCCGAGFRLEESAHGLLLSGGGDVHPRRYGQPVDGTEEESIDEMRDEMELTLTRAALVADLPILAICRGLQVLNVALGGGLVQHVNGHRCPPPLPTRKHNVRITADSRLAQVLGAGLTHCVNSAHHQAIDDHCLAPGLRAAARSLPDERVIEAVESPQQRWVVGVQWHPERVAEVPAAQQRLFSAFVAAAREEAARRRAK